MSQRQLIQEPVEKPSSRGNANGAPSDAAVPQTDSEDAASTGGEESEVPAEPEGPVSACGLVQRLCQICHQPQTVPLHGSALIMVHHTRRWF